MARRQVLALLLTAALIGAGHAHAQDSSVADGAGCKIAAVAQLPLEENHGRFSVPVSLNDETLPMLLDTGAQRGALTLQAADRLQLPTDANQTFRANGIGGRSRGEHPRLANSVRFGTAVWPRYALQTVNFLRPGQDDESSSPVGIVGADMLSAYDVELDFPAHTLTLYAVTGCRGDFVPWSGRYDILAPQDGPADLFIVPVTVSGHRLRALLDTGSNTSSLSRGAARVAGADDAALKGDRPDSYVGSKGVAVGAHRHRFDSLGVGAATFSNAQISVQDADFGPFDMLLGMDFMRTRKVWLSYRTHQVFMQSPRPIALADPAPATADVKADR